MNTASVCWRQLLTQAACCPFCFARASAGGSIAARMAMTTSSSISVKPRDERFGNFRDMAAPAALNARIYFESGTQTTPHGPPGDLTRAISLSVARSTTETSSDGPFAEKRYFPSGDSAMPHGRLPTGIVFSTS